MRRAWTLAGTAAVAAGLLATGCAKKEAVPARTAGGGAEEKRTITIWWAQWAPAEGLQELGNEFEKETGIAVKVHQIPWSSYQDQVFLEFGNRRTAFDIVVGDSQWLGKCATEGLYEDLTTWLPTVVDIAKLHPNARAYLCEYPAGSGKFFAAPCETDAMGCAYRKDWLEDPAEKEAFQKKYGRELTVPDTWDEFRQVAEFFTRPEQNRYGCVLTTGRGYDALVMGFQQVMWSFGGSWGAAETHRVNGFANSEASVAALEFFKSLLAFAPKGGASVDYDKILESYMDNKSAAMLITYFAFVPAIASSDMGPKTGYFVVPSKDGRRFASLGGQGMSISTKAPPPQRDLAKQFIAWFLRRETQEKWIRKQGGFTAHVDVLRSDAFREAAPYNAAFAKSLDFLKDFWNVPVYNELLSAAMQYLGEALDGVKTPKEALDKVAAEHERILREAGLLAGPAGAGG
jgi:multiple sugar transport system substrate-binding protein